jgi:hypothetical protein
MSERGGFMFTRFTSLIIAASALLAGGCQDYYFADSVDFELDFTPLVGASDDLHSPYVTGASFEVFAQSTDGDESRAGWVIESSDPEVLRVESTVDGQAHVVAMAPGKAIIRVHDGGETLHTEEVEVRAPASAELLWHGTLLVHRPEEEAIVHDARIATGGTATFLVRWRDERGDRLSGNGALQVETGDGLVANVEQSFLFEDRDWLQLTPAADGVHDIRISAGGNHVGTVSVTAVSPDAVDSIVLQGESEAGHSAGACLVVLAVAEDVEGRRIFGVEYSWDVDGESLRDYGDLLHYDFDPNIGVTVGASYGMARAETTVHASGGFVVSSTNSVGCSATVAGGGIPFSMAAPLALVGLWIARRRRQGQGQG